MKKIGVRELKAQLSRVFSRLASAGAMWLADSPREPYRASPIHAADGTARALLDEGRDER